MPLHHASGQIVLRRPQMYAYDVPRVTRSGSIKANISLLPSLLSFLFSLLLAHCLAQRL